MIIEHGTKRKFVHSPSQHNSSKKKRTSMLGSVSGDMEAGFSLGGPATDKDGEQFQKFVVPPPINVICKYLVGARSHGYFDHLSYIHQCVVSEIIGLFHLPLMLCHMTGCRAPAVRSNGSRERY